MKKKKGSGNLRVREALQPHTQKFVCGKFKTPYLLPILPILSICGPFTS